MAEIVVETFLTVVFEKLLEQLASPELRTNSVASKLKMLEEKLKKLRLYLEDAEDRQLLDKKVKEWLDDLKHVVFMADDMVETINNSKKSKRKAVAKAIKSVFHSLANNVQGEFDLILTDLEGLDDRAIVLKLKSISGSADPERKSSPTIVAPMREEHHIYGRKAEKEEILKMLFSEEDKMIVLPIVGMGGLGKTTLAQLVYNDKRVEEHGFSHKAWVTVSTKLDFCRIMKEILQEVNPRASSSDQNELQRLMQKALSGKRFLLVLDDFWEESYNIWDLLKTNFTDGSRVIVTTRSKVVGSMVTTGPIHELKEVQKKDCWSIFVHHAFNGDMDADRELQAIGRRIVDKCKGHPLAIICLGGLLRSERNPQKWENILHSDLRDWSKVMENGVLPSLWLSYRSLSSSLKQCFAYCSLFPQDYRFSKKEMILWWMAEGFIPSNEKGESMEEVGEEYFDELVSRSLFQRLSELGDKYVVHDLVHDLAAFVSSDFCLRICEDDDLKKFTIRTRHLTYNREVSSDLLTFRKWDLSTSKHLRTLMYIGVVGDFHVSSDFVKEIVLKGRCLRVLTISLKVQMLHHSLGDLKMLRYLNLSRCEIEELPDSICSLFHLQTLILSWCRKLTRLPKDLPGKMSKLRHLDASETSLREMPPKMGSLKELRILTDFVLGEGDGSGCSTLKELGELHHLGGKLYITELQNVDNLEDVQKANMRGKEKMKELCLVWKDNDMSNMILAVDVLDALQPHKNLEKLSVNDYPGSSFPKWVGETSFSKMAFVELVGGTSRSLPPLGQLPSLRELSIGSFEGVEKIGNEFLYGNVTNSSITPFPCLEELTFYDMINWKEWSFVGNESGCFPRLRTLDLNDCPELESIIREDNMPEMESTELDQHLASLCKLRISRCPMLEIRYEKYKGEHWHYISHIPHIYISGRKTDELEREEKETRQREEYFESRTKAALAVVFKKLFKQLASPELRRNSVASKLKVLKVKLEKVREYLDDAEDRQLFVKKVKEWLDDLKHVVFMADDLVEQINNSKEENNPKRKVDVLVDFSMSVYHSLAKTVQGEIDLILTDLEGLLERACDLDLKHMSYFMLREVGRSSPRIIAPLHEECHVYGREAEKEEILEMLLSEEYGMIVLPIVGMGGLGKTTLAQLVYDDKRIEEHGFLKAWVTVSTMFDFYRIMEELLQKVNPGARGSDTNHLLWLWGEGLSGKSFLFVLDDVWDVNNSNWDHLMNYLRYRNLRSRVIVTTRSRDVGSMVKTGPIHKLKEVQKDDCWSIFVHHAFIKFSELIKCDT